MTLPVKLRLDPTTMLGDLQRETGLEFDVDAGLETAVIISLFTHRLAEPDDELPGKDSDRQGWWADAYADIRGSRIGSRLWLLARSKTTAAVLARAKQYAEEALSWLIDDQVAKSVEVTVERVDNTVLALGVKITRDSSAGSPYQALWEVMLNAF